jgi:cell division septum initiation protein DivIVA
MYEKGIEDYQDEIEDLQKENTKLKAELEEYRKTAISARAIAALKEPA